MNKTLMLVMLCGLGCSPPAERHVEVAAPDPRAPHLQAAEEAIHAGDFALAEVALDAAFTVAPGAEIQAARERLVVRIAAATGKVDDEAAFRYALARVTARGELSEDRARLEERTALQGVADLALKAGDIVKARTALETWAGLAPLDAQPRRHLAALLRDVDRAASRRALTEAVALEPDSWSTFTLGVMAQEDGQHTHAVSMFERAVAMDPTAYAPYFHLALSLTALTDHAASRNALMRYLDTSRGVESEKARRALAEQALGKAPEAPGPNALPTAEDAATAPTPNPTSHP